MLHPHHGILYLTKFPLRARQQLRCMKEPWVGGIAPKVPMPLANIRVPRRAAGRTLFYGCESIQFKPRRSASAAISSNSSAPCSELLVQGMTCSNCARHASEALQSVEDVSLTTVDLARGRATVRWKPEATPHNDQLLASLAKAGYPSEIAPAPATPAPSASPTDRSSEPTQHAHDHDHASAPNPWRRSLAIGIPATVLLLGATGSSASA